MCELKRSPGGKSQSLIIRGETYSCRGRCPHLPTSDPPASLRAGHRLRAIGARSRSCHVASPSLSLRPSNFPPPPRILITSLLLLGFWDHGWNFHVSSGGINCDKRQIGRADVLTFIGNIVFHSDLYADLHRGSKDAVHRRA